MNKELQPNNYRTFSRRGFLKAAVVGGAAGMLGRNEIEKTMNNCVETPWGNFYPIYERHDMKDDILRHRLKEITAKTKLDGLALEYVGPFTNNSDPQDLLYTTYIGLDTQDQEPKKLIPSDILLILAKEQIPIVFCDLNLGSREDSVNFLELCQDQLKKFFLIRMGIIASSGLLLQIPAISRKKFLGGLLKGAFFISAPAASKFPTEALMMRELKNPATAKARAASRLRGLSSHLIPEDLNTLLRNLLVSRKMLVYAERLSKEKGCKPNIAFNYHGGHSGIEDFLQLGPEFTKTLISLFPNEILKKFIDLCGDLEDFCKIEEFKLPEDLKQITRVDNSQAFQFTASFSGRTFLDQKLAADLEERLRI